MRLALWVLSGLFFARVVGQVLVEFAGVRFLPPSGEWFSGLLPYPILLPVQAAILCGMGFVNIGVGCGRLFSEPNPRLGRFLLIASIVYAGVMLVRFFVSGTLHPERRFWPPGSLPIVFHIVLAAYLLTLSRLAARFERSA